MPECGWVTKPCLTFGDPMNGSPPDSSAHGIFQAGILGWVAISFYRGSYGPRDQSSISCIGRRILYNHATLEARCILIITDKNLIIAHAGEKQLEISYIDGGNVKIKSFCKRFGELKS